MVAISVAIAAPLWPERSAEEVGDRSDLLGLGQPHDTVEQRKTEHEHQHRAGIDAEEFEAAFGGQPDRAEEGP